MLLQSKTIIKEMYRSIDSCSCVDFESPLNFWATQSIIKIHRHRQINRQTDRQRYKTTNANFMRTLNLKSHDVAWLGLSWLSCLCVWSNCVKSNQSVIIRLISKSDNHQVGVRFINHKYDYRPTLFDTKFPYQLIIKITILEKHKK